MDAPTLLERAETLRHAAYMGLSYGPPGAGSHHSVCQLAANIAKAVEDVEKRVSALEGGR